MKFTATAATFAAILVALLTLKAPRAQADTVTFDSDTPGPQTAPWTNVESLHVTFSAPTATGVDPLVFPAASAAFTTQSLSSNGALNSSIELDFSRPATMLSLDFNGDVPSLLTPPTGPPVDDAVLSAYLGAVLVATSTVTPDFVSNILTTPAQTIVVTAAGGFDRAVFEFYAGGSPGAFGTEVIDNVVFTLVPLAPAAPTGGGGGAAPPAAVARGGGAAKKAAPILLIDEGAIASAETTGLLVPIVQRQVVQNASNGAIRDLNGRLFRARSASDVGPAGEFAGVSGGTLVRYLNFSDAIGADADDVMLDIRGGEGIAVSVHDTLLTGGAVIAVGPGGKVVVGDGKGVVEPGPAYAYNRFEVFSEFDYGFYDQDNLTELIRGFDSDTYSGTVGAEYRMMPWLHVGGAFSYLESDTNISNNYGNIDLDGTLLSGYATAFVGNFYVDALYSYGQFDNDIRRNTLLGRSAVGDTESQTHNVDINLGYNIPLTQSITAGPILGVNYATGDIDGYTETGGRNANLVYPDDDFESTIGRLGGHLTYTTDTAFGRVTVQGRAGWAHEFTPEDDAVSAALVESPFVLVSGGSANRFGGYTAEGSSAHVGEDWLELGVGVRLDLSRRWNIQLDYDGQFARDGAEAHFVGVKLSYEWGTEFLSALR